MDDDDDTQVYKDHGDALTIAYQSGYYDGKKAAQPVQRTWVDLTDEDINTTYWKREPFRRPTPIEFANDILAKFKEKNT
jgi:hypothetical protein